MILIADSGSTKTEWCVADKGAPVMRLFTKGINPYFQTAEEIGKDIEASLLPSIRSLSIEAVWFYGAGCASAEKQQIVADAISALLPASSIEVHSDLTGAARALCRRQAGIACILGTGSNSCLYDGSAIVSNVSPLGYILGDEGSGAVLGKRLVGDCLKNQLPGHLIEKFMSRYELTAAVVLERVYKEPFPNRYLAGLSRFLSENIDEPDIRKLVHQSFRDFFIRNVMQYAGFETYPVHFTGSVAFYYQATLKDVARSLDINIQRIEQTPMPGLLTYHS
ncbi:MAG: ATPase [Tannerellaceae bacterium]|jgi:N-acetylglucosamine kinase-like BadF-type ATPase|nr:ATPase [Tannerellaceae bacterium]